MPLVVFDLDGTLVDQAVAAAAWAAELVEQWTLPVEATESIASALVQRTPKNVVFENIVSTWSLPTQADAVWAAYRTRLPQLVQCTETDKAALRRLREAGWTLGVASNGMNDNQEGKLQATGLVALLDGWAISSEVGARKPDPAIFHALAQRLGCALEGWMIGDSLEHDVAGGTAAGLSTVWINPTTSAPPVAQIEPTFTATSVAEAVTRILDR
jgi:putative hydrolase of the HAD superfamily